MLPKLLRAGAAVLLKPGLMTTLAAESTAHAWTCELLEAGAAMFTTAMLPKLLRLLSAKAMPKCTSSPALLTATAMHAPLLRAALR